MKLQQLTPLSALCAIASAATTLTVSVGDNKKLRFNPEVLYADVGSTVEFVYYPMNHSVVQGAFDSPCAPLSGGAGFYSGYVPSAAGEASTAFVINITDKSPIYYYCSQAKHCQAGMVGVINPPSDPSQGILAYSSAAAGASENLPGSAIGGGSLIPIDANSSTPANVSTTTLATPLTETSFSTAAVQTAQTTTTPTTATTFPTTTTPTTATTIPTTTTAVTSGPRSTDASATSQGAAASSSSAAMRLGIRKVGVEVVGFLGALAWLGAGIL
ncbi:hypothetical protein MMC25_004510 [Agyrium rufum]|nr:hypothetical protein [Agyrium rufum]